MPVILSMLAGAVGKAALSMLGKLATEQFAQWAIMWGAKDLARRTTNTKDDEWVAKVEEMVHGPKLP